MVFSYQKFFSITVQSKSLSLTEVIHCYIVVLHVGSADIEARVVVGFVQVFI